jgi:hypothetical protein
MQAARGAEQIAGETDQIALGLRLDDQDAGALQPFAHATVVPGEALRRQVGRADDPYLRVAGGEVPQGRRGRGGKGGGQHRSSEGDDPRAPRGAIFKRGHGAKVAAHAPACNLGCAKT